MPRPELAILTYEEAETVGADLRRVWTGITGLTAVPSAEAATDLVLRAQRKAREIIAERSEA